ncbi:MAG: hypothetical protein H6822_19155 [Planctomycetaceae bacterium]|nr:hypothetical protein [Planctomycetales bacterium]MCB9924305.1 hypothetical protein [Planctomycetaceae bacterium]
MSMPHNFSDDPNSFGGSQGKSSNTKAILVAIVIVCSMMMLICGGVIFGVVMSVRKQFEVIQQQLDEEMGDQQSEVAANRSAYDEYTGFVEEGRYNEALESLNSALETDPENAFLHNNKAWLLATCPDDALRDGAGAIEHGTKACDLTNWRNFAYVDTVAAAYAEAGDFESAVKWQEEAIDLGDSYYAQDLRRRLRLYKANKPYREGAPPFTKTIEEDVAAQQPHRETETSSAPANESEESSSSHQPSNE